MMTHNIGDLLQRVNRLKKETPARLSPFCLTGCTVGLRECLDEVYGSVHEIMDLLLETYSMLEGARLYGIDNDDDYQTLFREREL